MGSLKGLTHVQRVARFGRFAFTPTPVAGNPEAIAITGNWIRINIAEFDVQQIVDIREDDAYRDGWRCRFHRLAGHALVALWDAWEQAGLLPRVLSFNGAWVPRYKRGRGPKLVGGAAVPPFPGLAQLSNHAWGTAFDINAKWNPLGQVPAPVGAEGSVVELVPLAEQYGFAWGGNFKSRPDGMHFEYVGGSDV